MQQLSLDYIRQIVPAWLAAGGSGQIELAALEPLLWRDGPMRLPELVAELKALGCHISLTTNGSLLAPSAKPLQQAGVDLVRLSWHTLNADTFRQITGQDAYPRFMQGLEAAIDAQLPLAINRVLLRGHCNDLAEQIAFADQHRLRLKLLDLYWMPAFREEYERFYISPAKAIADYADQRLLIPQGQINVSHAARGRIRYHTPHGGIVEYKLSVATSRYSGPCQQCPQQQNCLEGFGDYLRVFPDQSVSLCYMRPDLGRALPAHALGELPRWLTQQEAGLQMPLRLVLTGQCNFNCGFPGSEQSWCLKQGRGFTFPKRQLSKVAAEVIHVQTA
ncbi:radical SAM protein [Plesiomonas shigelloides]|uniref:radical SAM protein n=1 Tax=Plesiomonas shigelloides TaxID=703 RepID=UPI00396A184F